MAHERNDHQFDLFHTRFFIFTEYVFCIPQVEVLAAGHEYVAVFADFVDRDGAFVIPEIDTSFRVIL